MPRKTDATPEAVFEPEHIGGRVVMDRRLSPAELAAQDAERSAKLAAARAARFGVEPEDNA
jgi:hypothetical protein